MKTVNAGKNQFKFNWKKLIEECTENIVEVKIAGTTLAGHENVCVCSCTIYVVLTVIIFTTGAYFVCSRRCLKNMLLALSFIPAL